jgi:hypothetical protein
LIYLKRDKEMANRGIFSKIRWGFYALILTAMFTYNWYEAPFKVKDPAEPGFNPDKFRFRDYYQNDNISLYEAYRKLFPPGTPKEFVDRVLVDAGGAKGRKLPDANIWLYRRPANSIKGGAQDVISYDDNNRFVGFGDNRAKSREAVKENSHNSERH